MYENLNRGSENKFDEKIATQLRAENANRHHIPRSIIDRKHEIVGEIFLHLIPQSILYLRSMYENM